MLLNADGSLEPLPLRAGPFQAGFVVLARERCLFERLDVAPGLKSRAAEAAARLHADTGAPYARSSSLVTRKGEAFGIWWWDAQWVAEKLGGGGLDPSVRIVPEPLVRAAGEGWRIARGSTGYEAQLWRNGFLIADQWRRTSFDTGAWQDFVRVQGDQEGAETAVLMAQDPPWTLSSPYFRTQLSAWTPERLGQAAIAIAAAALVCLSLYLAGSAVGLKRNTEAAQTELAAIRAKTPKGAAGPQSQVTELVALRAAITGPDPMVMLQNVQQIVQPFGYKLTSFEAKRDGLRIRLPKEAVGDIDMIAAELAASPFFTDVRPSLDPKEERLTIDMTAKGAKLKTKAKT